MSATRARPRRALTLVPLMVLAVAAVNALTAPGVRSPTSAIPAAAEVVVPIAPPLREPASVSQPETAAPTSPLVRDAAVARVGSPSDIPSLALAAYQRADSVLGTADPDCGLRWELVAAIGRVESDHGRYAGSALDADGVAVPAILGPRLDGRRATARLRDSDGGALDRDKRFDRAVGPMQFIPSTWSVVGVDADGDGERNPQDLDDAALAAAVYLCAGTEDLTTNAGRRDAVHRYNHSDAYVDLVLRIMRAYVGSRVLTGSFTTAAISGLEPMVPRVPPGDPAPDDDGWVPNGGPKPGPAPEPSPGPTPGPSPEPKDPPAPPPAPAPTPTPTPEPAPAPTPEPAPAPEPAPQPAPDPGPTDPTTPPAPDPGPTEPPPTDPGPVEPPPAPPGELVAACAALGYLDAPAIEGDPFDLCVAAGDLVFAARETCTAQGLVDDPARTDDDYDVCVVAQLPVGPPQP